MRDDNDKDPQLSGGGHDGLDRAERPSEHTTLAKKK